MDVGNAEVVRRYLRIFETRTVNELADVMAPDVAIHGAGSHVSGREHVEDSVLTPGLSQCRVQIDDLFSAEDRVVAAFTPTYHHDSSGREMVMSGIKAYRLRLDASSSSGARRISTACYGNSASCQTSFRPSDGGSYCVRQ